MLHLFYILTFVFPSKSISTLNWDASISINWDDESLPNLPFGVANHIYGVYDRKLWIHGGVLEDGSFNDESFIIDFDTQTVKRQINSKIPTFFKVSSNSFTQLGDKIYFSPSICQRSLPECKNRGSKKLFFSLDLSTNKFERLPNIPFGHGLVGFCSMNIDNDNDNNGFIYAVGGLNSNRVCQFDINENKWKFINSLNIKRTAASCFADNGNVWVFGGNSKSIEKWNENDNDDWKIIPNVEFDEGWQRLTITSLIDLGIGIDSDSDSDSDSEEERERVVLITGGREDSGKITNNVWIFSLDRDSLVLLPSSNFLPRPSIGHAIGIDRYSRTIFGPIGGATNNNMLSKSVSVGCLTNPISSNNFVCKSPFENIKNSLVFNEIRTINGFGNNKENPKFGNSFGPIIRVAPNGFVDNRSIPARREQKSAREISNIVSLSPLAITEESDVFLSNFVWIWGGSMDHEIVMTPTTMELPGGAPEDSTKICIPILDDDPFFDNRNGDEPFCINIFDNTPFDENDEVQRQISTITSFIDGSFVYGSDASLEAAVRGTSTPFDGKLRIFKNDFGNVLNPVDENGFFIGGDVRANENIAFTAVHVIFLREHNRLVDEISKVNPELDGEELYQFARIIIAAEFQHINYHEFLPAIFGKKNFDDFFDINAPYDDKCDASISSIFSIMAYRVGHTYISPVIPYRQSFCGDNREDNGVNLRNAFVEPNIVRANDGISAEILTGLACTSARNVDPFLIPELRDLLLFGAMNNFSPMDLLAINIERGRDDGIADYVSLRKHFGLSVPTSFDDPLVDNLFLNNDIKESLRTAYNNNINVIDPIIAAWSEKHLDNEGSFGELLAHIWAEQFQRLISCDRFFYTRYLKGGLLKFIKGVTMRKIMERNSDIIFSEDHQNLFFIPGKGDNKKTGNRRPHHGKRSKAKANLGLGFKKISKDISLSSNNNNYFNLNFDKTTQNLIKVALGIFMAIVGVCLLFGFYICIKIKSVYYNKSKPKSHSHLPSYSQVEVDDKDNNHVDIN